MIVPQYWAEGRAQHKEKGRQITVRRFGWSNTSQAEAQANADQRTKEAFQRLLAGEKLPRREPKIAYNGADGVPIREEIVARHGETIITRNIYGARCLNTPNVLFADIDFQSAPSIRLVFVVGIALMACAAAAGWAIGDRLFGGILAFVALPCCNSLAGVFHRAKQRLSGDEEKAARMRVAAFARAHPAWNMRVYRTPAGLRVLVTHQTFSPSDDAVSECFSALRTDSLYVKMCQNQQCFRARVSPKPWRIGISKHIRPKPGVWPVRVERQPIREAWITDYEKAAKSFAACTFDESLGSGLIHPDVLPVQQLHDELSGALGQLPIA